jgi:ATP-dependent RNA helicase DeaD
MRDHIERNNLDTKSLRAVVLDEADEMLDLGFREELEAILDTTPGGAAHTAVSATVPRPIAQLAKQYQRDAMRIEATSQGEQHGDIEYRASLVAPHEMERAVVNILRPGGSAHRHGVLRHARHRGRLHGNLSERGFSAVALSGELSQTERTRALQNLRDGRARICVATDVAARGIDLPDLGLVLHAELPRDPDTLLHRSGRTGRAGRKGISWLIVPHPRRRLAERLFQAARVKVALAPAPTADAVRIRDGERLAEQARALLAEEVEENDAAIARTLLEGASPEALAATVVRLLRGTMPAPEELSEPPVRQGPAPRVPHAAPGSAEEGVWFRMDVGRDEGADPKWMLPFLCRRGHVTRDAIGRIRILGRETQFEVAPDMAEKFSSAIRKPVSGQDGQVRIEPVGHALRAPAHAPRAAERHAPRGAGPRQRR